MDTRPLKRQRRFTVYSSDTDDDIEAQIETNDANSASHVPITKGSRNDATQLPIGDSESSSKALPLLSSRPKTTSTSDHFNSRSYSSTPSPEKKKHGKPLNGESTGDSLHSFFQPANEEQRWSSQKFEPTRPAESTTEKAGDDDDLIEDDYDSFDELFTQHFINADIGSQGGTGAQENSQDKPCQDPPSTKSNSIGKRASSTKRFLLPQFPKGGGQSQPSATGTSEDDARPWAQKYGPSNLDELAVHKRKVTDVQNWLNDVFIGRNRCRLLVLRGPAGCGKTTTVSLLSKALGFDVLEWKNPPASKFNTKGYTSTGAQLEEFLGRGDKFSRLELDGTESTPNAGGSHGRTPSQRRIILIEDFPTILNRNSSGLAAFRLSLQRYLAATAPSRSSNQMVSEETMNPPIVLVVSETLLGSASSVLDNLTAHRLLGPDIYNHPNATFIDFNSIAPTYMQKALRLVLEKEARHSRRVQVPGPAFLERMSEVGDIRSAISSLEFVCLRGDKSGAWGGSINKKTKKSSQNGVGLTQMEKESLKMVTQREASLGIFHAVGKIVYNKRDEASSTTGSIRPPSPPDHLRHHERPKISQVCVDELMDETGTDIQTFISALHENYVPSCECLPSTDCLDECIGALSDSDMLCADQRGAQRHRARVGGVGNFSAGVDMLRQDEISYQVATRGLLFALPHPVKRKLGSGRGNDAYKMSYPTSLRLWGASEEIEGLIDLWMKHLLNPFGTAVSQPSGIQSWKNRSAVCDIDQYNDSDMLRTVTMMPRNDALLWHLPYMAKISQNEVESKELHKITSFRIGAHGDPHYNNDDHGNDPLLGPNRLLRRRLPHTKDHSNSSTFGPQLPQLLEDQEEKLVLSDDDIVDD